jgi:hypothetical protein
VIWVSQKKLAFPTYPNSVTQNLHYMWDLHVVKLISQDRVQRLDPTPLPRPDRGRPTVFWLVGPCGSAILTEVGAEARSTRFNCVALRPTDTPTDLGLALGHGKHRRHHSPTLTLSPIAMASGSTSSSTGAGFPLSHLSVSLPHRKSFDA